MFYASLFGSSSSDVWVRVVFFGDSFSGFGAFFGAVFVDVDDFLTSKDVALTDVFFVAVFFVAVFFVVAMV